MYPLPLAVRRNSPGGAAGAVTRFVCRAGVTPHILYLCSMTCVHHYLYGQSTVISLTVISKHRLWFVSQRKKNLERKGIREN